MQTIDLLFKCEYKFLAFVLCILFLILQYIMCALVHTSCFVSIKPIYVQYKKSTQKKIFPTQLISRSSSPKEKNDTKHRAIAKIPYKSVSGCHPEKKKKKCVKPATPPKEERNDHQMQTMDEANAVQEIEFTDKSKAVDTRKESIA